MQLTVITVPYSTGIVGSVFMLLQALDSDVQSETIFGFKILYFGHGHLQFAPDMEIKLHAPWFVHLELTF